jgi:hypothetical protein
VRNFNRRLPGSPIPEPHESFDEALPFDAAPYLSRILEPEIRFHGARTTSPHQLVIAPLAMQTEHFFFDDELSWFELDASGLAGAGHLSLDVIVKVGEEWSLRRLGAPVFAFCRDAQGDDISEAYVLFSNFGHRSGDAIAGRAEIRKGPSCPGGWSGTIQYVRTVEEHWTDEEGLTTTVFDRSERETQTWSLGTTRVDQQTGVETVEASWRGGYDLVETETVTNQGCSRVTTRGGNDGSSGQTTFSVFGVGGAYSFSQNSNPHSYSVPIATTIEECNGETFEMSDEVASTENFGLIFIIPEVAMGFQETRRGSGTFSGSGVAMHDEQPMGDGGTSIQEVRYEWHLQRR